MPSTKEIQEKAERIQFIDFHPYAASKLGQEPWIIVWQHNEADGRGNETYYSALLPKGYKQRALSDYSWDLSLGSGMPWSYRNKETGDVSYFRFSDNDGIEPLVFSRNFNGAATPFHEICEDFRHYFNLFEKPTKRGTFIYVDDSGDEEEVVRQSSSKIEIKLGLMKRYLTARDMFLALYFEHNRFELLTLDELGIKAESRDYKSDNIFYHASVVSFDLGLGDEKTLGRVMGKKIISGLDTDDLTEWEGEPKQYEEFIIKVDTNGKPVLFTCNESDLLDMAQESDGTRPYFLTPIFFSQDVLSDYYSNPDKYEVQDGYVSCYGLWGLRMDNNHDEHVIAYLGDLGHLPYKEQQRWKRFNIVPDGGISVVEWRRGFMAEFADPERVDLKFKHVFRNVCRNWQKNRGWNLFLPLAKADSHHLISLHIPNTDNQAEFDQQILSLCKVVIESINIAELRKQFTPSKVDLPPIGLLEEYLANIGFSETGKFISILRRLQAVRSAGTAHRKGDNYDKAMISLGLDETGLRLLFTRVLSELIEHFEILQ